LSDAVLFDGGTEMGFTRSYVYYPYGRGWAKILGGAGGSLPAHSCKVEYVSWDIRDIYKPRSGT
jgi:hypothetical protein